VLTGPASPVRLGLRARDDDFIIPRTQREKENNAVFNNTCRAGVILVTLFMFGLGLRSVLVQNGSGTIRNSSSKIVTSGTGMVVLSKEDLRGICSSAALDPVTGNIIVTGFANFPESSVNFLAASVLPTGALNTAFGGGIVVTNVSGSNRAGSNSSRACAVQPDGKVLSGGPYEYWANGVATYGFALVRYNIDGTVDKTFNESGIVTANFNTAAWLISMVLQSDGKIVVTGNSLGDTNDLITARYTSSGQLDSTFGSGGTVVTTIPNQSANSKAIALQSNGSIIVGANLASSVRMALIRYTANGDLDTSFGGGGIATFGAPGLVESTLRDIVIDPADNSIIAVGDSSDGIRDDLTIVRFTAGGLLDATFGDGSGHIREDFESLQGGSAASVALQDDGKIIICGGATPGKLLVARFNTDGTLDQADGTSPGFGPKGKGYAEDFPHCIATGHSLLVQSDGRIVVAGVPNGTGIGIVRYHPDGTPDRSF
jgi:uncharacterized delta-60 repeat protein